MKKIFLILALLCTIVQMSWAQNFDVWDGHTVKEPRYYTPYQSCHGVYKCIEIKTAAELAWLQENFTEPYFSFEWYDGRSSMYCRTSLRDVDVVLTADLDMTAVKWEPIGFNNEHSYYLNILLEPPFMATAILSVLISMVTPAKTTKDCLQLTMVP